MNANSFFIRLTAVLILCSALFVPFGKISADNSPLCFTARNGSVTVKFDIRNVSHTIQYSTNGSSWSTYTSNKNVTINANQSVYFRAASNQTEATAFGTSIVNSSNFSFFSSDGGIVEGSGNIMSLYGPSCPDLPLQSYAFAYMFWNCKLLTVAPELPATNVAEHCYEGMFLGCETLTSAPSLLATIMACGCYENMFNDCKSLITAPFLRATTLAEDCYNGMFWGCESLIFASSLPATTLDWRCYKSMFEGCTSLTTAPSLPATTLANNCYESMFEGCTSLATAPSLPATTLANSCYESMFKGCVSIKTLPILPATTLAAYCYEEMFKNCTSLVVNTSGSGDQWIILATSTVTNALTDMFVGTSGNMHSTPSVNTTYYIERHSVIINANDSDRGSVSGSGLFYHNETTTLIATPKNHCHFVCWSDGETSNPRTIMVQNDMTLTAIFEIDRHTVSSNSCLIEGIGEYDYGTLVTITAHSDEHARFVEWEDGVTDSTRSFVLQGDITMNAVYDIDSLRIYGTCQHGTVTGNGTYQYLDIATLAVNIDDGYRFVKWSDNNEYNPRVFVVRDDLTVEAICEEAPVIDDVENVEADAPAFYVVGTTVFNPSNEPLRVYSAAGKLIQAGNSDINMECYPKGMYIVMDGKCNCLKMVVN